MVNFTVNIVSDKDDSRVPVALAGQIMIDIQALFTHIGEYLTSRELRIQTLVNPKFDEKFRIYMDGNGEMSFNASTDDPETKGFGDIIEDTIAKMEETLDVMGNGTGSYWMEDNFADALYRNAIIYDIVALHQDLVDSDGFHLEYGSTDELKRFGYVDVEKLSTFIKRRGLSFDGATIGILERSQSKSGKGPRYIFSTGKDVHSRISFKDRDELERSLQFIGDCIVVVAGTFTYSDNGDLISIDNAEDMCEVESIKFHRLISPIGDVSVTTPVEAKVSFKNNKWILSNEDLGIMSSSDSWDSAVQSFHDYFVFLWSQYTESDDEGLSEEELEVKSALLSHVA